MGKKLNSESGIQLHNSVAINFTSPCFYSFLLTSNFSFACLKLVKNVCQQWSMEINTS